MWHGIGVTLDLLVVVVIFKIVVILHQGSRLSPITNDFRWVFSFNMLLYRAINQVLSLPRRLYWLAMQRHKVLAVIWSNNLGSLASTDWCTQIWVKSRHTRKFRVVSLVVITLSLTRLVLMEEGSRVFFSMALLSGTLRSWLRFRYGKSWQLASVSRLRRCTIAATAQVVMFDWWWTIAKDLVVRLLHPFWPNFNCHGFLHVRVLHLLDLPQLLALRCWFSCPVVWGSSRVHQEIGANKDVVLLILSEIKLTVPVSFAVILISLIPFYNRSEWVLNETGVDSSVQALNQRNECRWYRGCCCLLLF